MYLNWIYEIYFSRFIATILRRQFSGDNSPAAILRWTILRRAILRWTILRRSILRRSILRRTILRWTILRQTMDSIFDFRIQFSYDQCKQLHIPTHTPVHSDGKYTTCNSKIHFFKFSSMQNVGYEQHHEGNR